jgi:hypothetical protein
MRISIKNLFVMGLVLSVSASAMAADLPFPNVKEAADTFKSWRDSKRASHLQRLIEKYADNTDVSVATNLITYGKEISTIISDEAKAQKDPLSEVQKDAKREVSIKVVGILDQSYFQIATLTSPLTLAALIDSYRGIQTPETRRLLLEFWNKKLDTMVAKDLKDVQVIRDFRVIEYAR